MSNFNPFPDNNGAGDPAKAKALLAQAHQTGVTLKLLYSTTDPMPRVAQSLQSSLDAAGFKVKLVSATQSDFYGKYLEVPATAKRDVWDLAPPGWIPDWFGNNGRSTIVPLLTQPGPGSNDFDGYTSATVREVHQPGPGGAQHHGGEHGLAAGRRGRHEGRGRGPDQRPEVADLPLLGGARLQLLLVRPELRPDECVAEQVSAMRMWLSK